MLAVVLTIFVLLFYYLLEDAVYVERDAESRFGLPVYGLLTKENDALQKQMFGDNLNAVFGEAKVETWNGEMIPTGEDCDRLKKTDNLLLNIPWGRNNCRQAQRVLRQLEIQDVKVSGIIITDADDVFVKAYYAVERRGMRK